MDNRPDYENLRSETKFRWYVSSAYYVFWGLVDIAIQEVNAKPEAMIELSKKGRPLFREMWGDEIPMPGISTPAISYGLLNGPGAELIFPKGGEVNFTVICDSISEGI